MIRGGSVSTGDASRQPKESGVDFLSAQKKEEKQASDDSLNIDVSVSNEEETVFEITTKDSGIKKKEILTTKRDGTLETLDRDKVCA